jgi:RNA polymerase sigma factor (sigma-70 family)
VIDAARSADADARSLALEILSAAYWKPIYKYIRLRWNRHPEDAQDLTQGFFAQFLERDLLARFDPQKSRLRTYLRLCVDSFVANEAKAASRQKRGGNAQHLALGVDSAEEELRGMVIDPATIRDPESMEEFFEKEWIRALFSAALDDLRQLCQARDQPRAFLIFEAYDLDSHAQVSYEMLSQAHGISVTAVTNALSFARREFRRLVLERLKQICASDDEFNREARSLFGRKAV